METCMLCGLARYSMVNELAEKDYLVELKYDGERALAHTKGVFDFELFNRRGRNISVQFPEIVEAIRKWLPPNCMVDGEIVAGNLERGGDFQTLQKRTHLQDKFKISLLSKTAPATYIVFDVLKWIGQDLTNLPLEERLEKLKERSCNRPMCFNTIKDGWSYVQTKECEGLILKRKGSHYSYSRSDNWLKLKDIKKLIVEVVQTEITIKGGFKLYCENGIKVACGKRENFEHIKELLGAGLKPLVEIAYLETTEKDNLRQPVFSRIIGGKANV